jgi:hypothetical protein
MTALLLIEIIAVSDTAGDKCVNFRHRTVISDNRT